MDSFCRLFLALTFAVNIPLSVLSSPSAFAAGKKAKASKEDTEKEPLTAPSPDNEDDDDGEGDPFLRFERATMKDQNCDPTFLLDLYRNYRTTNCLTTYMGFCLNPSSDNYEYGVPTGAGVGVVTLGWELGKNSATDAMNKILKLRDAQIAELQASHAEILTQVKELRLIYGAEGAIAPATSSSITAAATAEAEKKLTAGRVLKAVFKGTSRGLLVGALVTLGYTFYESEYRAAISQALFSTPTGCAAIDENDPNFKKYVPVMPGTCRTEIFTPGHPKVLAFLELPLEKKLSLLKENRLLCGYYKGLNRELEQRIESLNGKTKIKNVSCNAGTGEITFQSTEREPEKFFKLRRKPKTLDFTSYSYESRLFGLLEDGATFDLTKQDENTIVSKTRVYNKVSLSDEIIANDKLVEFSNGRPQKAAKTFEAFRAARKFAPTLAVCCDNPLPVEKEKTKRKPDPDKVNEESLALKNYNKICHGSWFGRSADPAAASSSGTSSGR